MCWGAGHHRYTDLSANVVNGGLLYVIEQESDQLLNRFQLDSH